jgi:hypothetical protein
LAAGLRVALLDAAQDPRYVVHGEHPASWWMTPNTVIPQGAAVRQHFKLIQRIWRVFGTNGALSSSGYSVTIGRTES